MLIGAPCNICVIRKFLFRKATNPKASFPTISASEYVACYCDSERLVELMEDVNSDKKDVQIMFFTSSRTLKQLYLAKEARCLMVTKYE